MSPDPRPAHRSFADPFGEKYKEKTTQKISCPPPLPSQRSFADPSGVINEKTPRRFQFGKKSAKVYHSLYSSTEQLQVAL